MVDAGGLSPREAREAREAREVTQAAKVALDARRAEDIELEARDRGHQRARRTGLRLCGHGLDAGKGRV
jgi:type II secretory pathway pseudopilin PulG